MSRQKFLKKLHEYGEKNNIPNISQKNEIFLRNIISKNMYKNILEIWSANGYSTICFADELEKNWGWHIVSIEFSQKAYEDAQDNFEKADVQNMIEYYFWDAREIIPHLWEKKFDFIFIDWLKKASLDFYLLTKDLLTQWGIIVIDDVIKFRYKMENFYEYLETQNISHEIIKIDEDDGIMIIHK